MPQENGATDNKSRRRAMILCGVALVALLATLKLLGVFGHFQRVEATVTDSATSEPLAAATIVALYTRSCVGSDGLKEKTVVFSHQTSSDNLGVFLLEEANLFAPPGPKTFSVGLCQFSDEPEVYVAKSGYFAERIIGPLAANVSLSPQNGEDDLEGLRLSVEALEDLLTEKLLAKAAPAFYTRLERDLEQMSHHYETLHKEHVDSLQNQLKELSKPALGKEQ